MTQPTLTLFLLTILFACSDRPEKVNGKVFKDTVSTTLPDIIRKTEILIPDDTLKVPTKYFISIISFIDSSGFIPDTNRIKKVGYYKPYPVFLVKNIPFYKMDTATNKVFDYIRSKSMSSIPSYDSTRKSLLYKNVYQVKSITGFYFADKNISDFRTDAFIEEWEFENEASAEKAEKALVNRDGGLSKTYYFVYFNSFAHVFRKNNYLYTFYSRSSWDERRLEKIYKHISQ